MRQSFHFIVAALAAASLQLAGCQEGSTYTKVEPAHVEHKDGEEISKLTLTEKAMERLNVQTAPVRERQNAGGENAGPGSVVPYSAIVYVAQGGAFVYTSPEPGVFIRQAVEVDHIDGDVAVLKAGPALGTQIVTVGATELFGTEFGVGH
jgi:hypothetical protein